MATPSPAQAQRSIGQYNHRAWRLVDGAPPDIWAITQTPDGFLWLGTGAGLVRFDGITFEPVAPRRGNLPSQNITALLAAPDGALWLGFFSGEVAQLRDGTLTSYGRGFAAVEQLARDAAGTIWVARSGTAGGLFTIDRTGWHAIGPAQGFPGGTAFSVLVARDGAVWAASEHHILVKRPGARRFTTVRESRGVVRLAEAPDGRIWASGDARQLSSPPTNGLSIVPLPPGARDVMADRLLFTRDGALWETVFAGGLLQIRGLAPGDRPAFDRFSTTNGLTSPIAVPLFEDREGNLWIGTNLGLNRLRPVSAVTALTLAPDARSGFEIAATAAGTVYVASGRQLYRARAGGALAPLRLLPDTITTIEGDGEALIIGQPGRVLRLRGETIAPADVPPPDGDITAWSRDRQGTPWVTVARKGVFRLVDSRWQPVTVPGPSPTPGTLHVGSGAGGSEWLFAGHRLYRRTGNAIAAIPANAAPAVGQIALVSTGPAGVFVAGEFGIAHLAGGRFRTIDARRVPVLAGITGLVQRDDGSVWISGLKGLVSTSRAAIATATAAPPAPLDYHLFSAADGLPGVALQDQHKTTAVQDGEGRIWVANNIGIGSIDPANLTYNPLPPPVIVRDLVANGRRFVAPQRVALPAGTQNLRISYTALSLAAAEQSRFRYRLEGVDAGWIDAGTRREAFYANLQPGTWRFRVIAANNDGVWNRTGAAMVVTIAPSFYQTGWFRLLVLAALLGTVWLLYVWRVREHLARARARADAQISERERIARELHDTLLQSMQGLMLRFQAAAYATAPGSRAQELIETALERADDVLIEARDRVMALRAAPSPAPLAASLRRLAAQFAEDGLDVAVELDPDCPSLAAAQVEQLLAIIGEALSNVLRHARATRAEITMSVAGKRLAIAVRDDGVGFPDDVRQGRQRSGHFGLIGIQERAALLGGTIEVTNHPDGGAIIHLSVPITRAAGGDAAAPQ
ncbi:sensor histidine kinase [Sphingomonas sp. RS6]